MGWIPLTDVSDSNSLYVETKRDAGDFRAWEMRPGQVARFYGNQVLHYTTPNETDSTRVSLDFRVLREEEWSVAAFSHFPLGGYFGVMTADAGLLTKRSPELLQLQAKFGCLSKSQDSIGMPSEGMLS